MIIIRENIELKQLAEEIYRGEVFTSMQVKDMKEVPMVFMPLALMNKKQIKELIKKEYHTCYEHTSERASGNINGYPMFLSCHWLTKEEWEKTLKYHKEIKEAVDNVGVEEKKT